MASVVLIEPYYGGSHRSWADGWVQNSRHDIALVTHPDEFWRWRLRGGAVTLAEAFVRQVSETGKPDVVVVSGLVDVAAFAGHTRRTLNDTPLAVYVHESQLLYPLAPKQRVDTTHALVNWQSLIAADAVWFNSAFHRDALRAALPDFLAAQPTPSHGHLVEPVFDRAAVLWPGVETRRLIEADRTERSIPRVLWNQRWGHDKNPHAVFSALVELAGEGVPFSVALAGQNHHSNPDEFRWVVDQLGDRIDHLGFLSDRDYAELLLTCDVVVSAADHEFFGIALVEAMAAGAVPVLPARLSFPELIEPQWQASVLYPDGELRRRVRSVLTNFEAARRAVGGLRSSMDRFDVGRAALAHDHAVDQLLGL